jgi:hypothetical protein
MKQKPGWKTTEFWLTILSNLVTVIGTLKNVIPPEKAAMYIGIINAIYGIIRTYGKTNQGDQINEKTTSTVVSVSTPGSKS